MEEQEGIIGIEDTCVKCRKDIFPNRPKVLFNICIKEYSISEVTSSTPGEKHLILGDIHGEGILYVSKSIPINSTIKYLSRRDGDDESIVIGVPLGPVYFTEFDETYREAFTITLNLTDEFDSLRDAVKIVAACHHYWPELKPLCDHQLIFTGIISNIDRHEECLTDDPDTEYVIKKVCTKRNCDHEEWVPTTIE